MIKDHLTENQIAKLARSPLGKHPGSIAIVNYKGGVGKTTFTCLLGYYLAELNPNDKVLVVDIDAQCSLSLALGFDPDDVSKTELTVYNLVKPSKWTKIGKTKFENYARKCPDRFAPANLHIIAGSFETDTLDTEIIKTLDKNDAPSPEQLYLYCKQLVAAYDDYKYVLIDCPPNKMYVTQAMLKASQYFVAITIPDAISVYGMPRLFRWVNESKSDRPDFIGYVLNAINRTGGLEGGKTYSQQDAEGQLIRSIAPHLAREEKVILKDSLRLGQIPRLDMIARFLSERDSKLSRSDFRKKTSNQPSVEECMTGIVKEFQKRLEAYRANN